MSTEQCPQCQNPWPAGQETCPNCGYTMAASGAQFRTGETGIRPMPTMPEQGAAQPPPPPAQQPQQAPGPPVVTPGAPPPVQYGQPYNPPGTPPPVQYGYQQQQAYMAQQQPAGGLTVQPLVLIGAVLAAVGGVLPWVGEKFLGIGGHTISSFKIPVNALWDLNASDSGFKIGILLIILGVLALVMMFVPQLSGVRRIVGLVTIAVAVAWAIQGSRELSKLHEFSAGNFFKIVCIGVFVTLIGGLILLVAPGKSKSS